MEATRVDRWLWSIRAFKSRAASTAACQAGHVKINGATVKPAHPAHRGDRIEITGGERRRELVVVDVIDKRVGAPLAVRCYVDESPPPERAPDSFVREAGAGRPTKRDRRQLDRLRRG